MGWQRLQNLDSDTDPGVENIRKKLSDSLRASLGAANKLDRVEIARQQGRKGFVSIGTGIGVDPDDATLDPDEGAAQLIALAQEHADANGPAMYQAVAIGETQKGQPKTHWKIAIDLRDETGKDREHYTEGLDVLRATKHMIETLVSANSTLLHNSAAIADKMREQVEVSIKAQMNLVELKKVELEYRDKHEDRQVTLQLEKIRDERIRAGLSRLWDDLGPHAGEVFGAWLHDMQTRAQASAAAAEAAKAANGAAANDAPRGATPRTLAGKLASLLEPITDGERVRVGEILGENAWDLIQAAAKAPDDEQTRAILSTLAKHWRETLDKAAGLAMFGEVTKVLGPRAAPLLAFLQRHAKA